MKILIGIITYSGKNYILKRWLERLNDIIKLTKDFLQPRLSNCNLGGTEPKWISTQIVDKVDVLIVDNTNDDGENAEYLRRETGFNVIKEKYLEETNANLANSRNRLRKEFLFENYDYLFDLESDVIPPREIIIELLSHKVPVVSGWYWVCQGGHFKRPCIVLPFKKLEGAFTFEEALEAQRELRKNSPENLVELELTKNRLVRVLQGSMGCCLIKREVLEKISFFNLKNKNNAIVHDDTFFFIDCEMRGIPVYVDSDMLCNHFQSNWWREFVLKREAERLGDSENQIEQKIKEVN